MEQATTPKAVDMNIPSNQEEVDVLVVGGGPTGLWLSCELALARVRVTVLEKLAEPTGLSKALGLQSRTMEMFEYRGILHRSRLAIPRCPSLTSECSR